MNAIMQMALIRDDGKAKTLQTVSVEQLVVSEYNPRRTRSQEQIDKLAQRIERNGYELTRALWAYPVNKHFEVFAGGTRLEAVKRTSIDAVPVIIHEGFTPDEITRLADQDNENDEYHEPVSIVDVWMDYKRLSDMGWTGERIAKAKGVSGGLVSLRLQYAEWPSPIRDSFTNGTLTEGHAREFRSLLQCKDFDWMSFETAALEIIELAVKRGGTAKHFAELVAQYNAVIELAQECSDKLPEAYREQFYAQLAKDKARTKPKVSAVFRDMADAAERAARIEAERLARQQNEAEAERMRLEREAAEAQRMQTILGKLHQGDARIVAADAPAGIKLVLTDPPYGQNFQSNRRVVSEKAPRLANDDEQAFDLLADVLRELRDHMADDSTLLVWSSWRYECKFRQIVTNCGFTIRGSLIWDKPNHGSGDLEGAFAPKHERIIHAVKGNPKLNKRHDDVLTGSKFLNTGHPTEKPIDLLTKLIEATTHEGDIVADPFVGGGSTVVAAYRAQRDFWACELDAEWHKQASSALYEAAKEQA